MDAALFVSQASCVDGLQFSTIPANELGAFGRTPFPVTGLTCDVPRGEVPGRLIIFTFFPCLILDLRQAGRHGGISGQTRHTLDSEFLLGSPGQPSYLTEDAQN